MFSDFIDKKSDITVNEDKTTSDIPKQKSNKNNVGNRILNSLQSLGKAIQFPIAVLPFAAILNRFGALGITYSTGIDGSITNEVGYYISFIIQTPGAMMFNNLPLLFAIGIGFGLSKDHRGEAALASVAFFLVTTGLLSEHGLPQMIYGKMHNSAFIITDQNGTEYNKLFYIFNYDANGNESVVYHLDTGVLGGIVAGCLVAFLYNKYKDIRLPQALSFFGGRRFIPMIAIVSAIPIALLYAIIWPWFQFALTEFANVVASKNATYGAQVGGVFVFGILNRIMLAFGLHMILNAVLWFQVPIVGDKVHPITGVVMQPDASVNGDINAFTAGIASSGNFQTGFFPIMMGGLPAAVIAMIFAAKKENRVSVAGFLGGAAFISFLTGITEPIEYSFIFLSPVLLLVHALYTGISMAITVAMQIHVGFGFSAGFIDYAISIPQSWGIATYQLTNSAYAFSKVFGVLGNPLMILPLTVGMFALYYFTFVAIIKKMDIKTPGREDDYVAPLAPLKKTKKSKSDKDEHYQKLANEIIEAIGLDNIEVVDNCATRLRLELKDNSTVDIDRIKKAGAFGTQKSGKKSFQVIIGPDVENVANILHDITHK